MSNNTSFIYYLSNYGRLTEMGEVFKINYIYYLILNISGGIKMDLLIDNIAELGLNVLKGYISDGRKKKEIKNSIQKYIENQSVINEFSDYSEEIDFQGLVDYMSSDLLIEVRNYIFGDFKYGEEEYRTIINKAYTFSKADNDIKKKRVEKIIKEVLNILYNFYRGEIDSGLLFVSKNIQINIIDEIRALKEEINKQQASINIKITDINERAGISQIYANNSLIEEIHKLITEKYLKSRYKKTKLSDINFELYSDLFLLSIDVMKNKNKTTISGNIFDYIRENILSQENENLIKVVGADGTGKSTFLSILYLYLYNYCVNNNFSFFPFYINLHYYDSKVNNSSQNDVKEIMYEDLKIFKRLVEDYPNIPYIIIIDGNENYFRTTLKLPKIFDDFLKDINAYKKIVCIGERTNAHESRKASPIAAFSKMIYLFKFKSINRYEKQKWKNFINCFVSIENNTDLIEPINKYLENFDLDEVDLNILSVFRECYDSDLLNESTSYSISDIYKNYCMSRLIDEDDFNDSAKMSYEYFLTDKKFTQDEIYQNCIKWNLIHQHKTVSNFLIAYYFVEQVKKYNVNNNTENLEYLFSRDVNIFIKPLINESSDVQNLILEKCTDIYENGNVLAKVQALYMLGRITNKGLRNKILGILENYYADLYNKVVEQKSKNDHLYEKDLHLILRSIIISMINLGKKDKRDIYLNMLLNYPVANQINRGFHLDYYGDVSRKATSKMFNYIDDGTDNMEITYNLLLNRIQRYLLSGIGTEDPNFQINLFTLCSLIQVRLEKDKIKPQQLQIIVEIIDKTLKKQIISINKDFKAYLIMLREDIEQKKYAPHYLYKKLYGVKDIVRKGWEQEIRNHDNIKYPYENVAEHIYYTWMLGMLYLPENPPEEKEYELYDKRKILDAILIHDWAEIDVGDAVPKENTYTRREKEDFRMRILLMHDTYSFIANMSQYKNAWNIYGNNSSDINGKLAYELDKIQALYQFYIYKNNGANFTEEKVQDWKNEKNKITTSLGNKILKQIVQDSFENNK